MEIPTNPTKPQQDHTSLSQLDTSSRATDIVIYITVAAVFISLAIVGYYRHTEITRYLSLVDYVPSEQFSDNQRPVTLPPEADPHYKETSEAKPDAEAENDSIIVGSGGSSCKSNKFPNSPYASVRSGYVITEDAVYFDNGETQQLVVNADPKSFVCLEAYWGTTEGRFYGKDATGVYFNGQLLPEADPQTFSLFKGVYYAKDKTHVFANGKILVGADPQSFFFESTNVGEGMDGDLPARHYAHDATHVIINDVVLENSDPNTFTDVGQRWLGYAKDKNNVYYGTTILSEADPDTFSLVVDGLFFKDKNHVFYKQHILEGADPNTFTVLSTNMNSPGTNIESGINAYAKDRNYYYKNDTILASTNDPNIRTLNDTYLLVADTLLWSGKSLTIADPINLEYLDIGFLRDSQEVYSTTKEPFGVLEGVDPDTFAVYANDRGYEYYMRTGDTLEVTYALMFDGMETEEVIGADLDSFRLIEWPYARDQEQVFYLQHLLTEADPETFRVISSEFRNTYAADATHVYFENNLLTGADPDTFRLEALPTNSSYTRTFAVDATSIYFMGTKLEGIDPTNVHFERGDAIIADQDTKWYMTGGCHGIWYVPESEVDVENYHPPC